MQACGLGEVVFGADSTRVGAGQIEMAFRGGGEVSTQTSGGNPAMDYNEHYRTYSGFLKGAKYLVGAVVVTLVLMAIFLL